MLLSLINFSALFEMAKIALDMDDPGAISLQKNDFYQPVLKGQSNINLDPNGTQLLLKLTKHAKTIVLCLKDT